MSSRPEDKRPLIDGVLGFWPRLTVREGKAIEQALAGDSLFQQRLDLRGAVVEATFAAGDPPLVRRLREDRVPYLIDPQSLRFASPGFLGVEQVRSLPYAPNASLSIETDAGTITEYVAAALRFQQAHGAAMYVAPQLPLERVTGETVTLNRRILSAAAEAVGRGDLERRPLLGLLAPAWSALRDPEPIARMLADLPVEGIYVQPTLLQPTRDSVEKLVAYGRLLRGLEDELAIPTIAGRVGAFGLVLQALGATRYFDSGLGAAEAFNLAQLVRPKRPSESGGRTGSSPRRVYLEPLMTTVQEQHARAIMAHSGLRSRFTCALPCCQFARAEDLVDRRRLHYLWVRQEEVNRLEQDPAEMRLLRVQDQLVSARGNAARVRKATGDTGPIVDASFDHLDRWLGVVARIAGEHALVS